MKNTRCKIVNDTRTGEQLILVPLTKRPGLYAVLDLKDYTRLLDLGYSGRFHLAHNGKRHYYVRASRPSCDGVRLPVVDVARLIVEVEAGKQVEYIDGDRLNLRRGNLRRVVGKSKFSCEPYEPQEF
jgi:hypothetical protein